jgi:tetratricopeptide (TPR) repeat protein
MYQEKRYAEVIAAATPALEGSGREEAARGRPSHETAALWSILGLARQALDDEDGARAAFEEAIRVAPAAERAAYRRHLAALAQMVARKLIARAEVLPDTTGDERITMLKNAVLWLRQGLACAPEDPDLLQALERSRKGLWVSYGHLATAFIQRQEFHGARRLIREILAEEDVPEDRREAFRDLLAATFSGEIGQLTAHAIRTMQDEHEREALTSLERAERLLSSIPDEALSPTRREEVNRRLWWGYTKLGVRRLESGEYEDALGPLFRALRFEEVDGDRQQETRTALVRALEGATTARVEAIDQLLKTGNREAAAAEGERLRTLLREGLDVGLSVGDLTSVLATSRRVLDGVETGS